MKSHELPQLGIDGRILEGIVTTLNPDRSLNIAPMGPIVNEQIQLLVLRPFCSSTTFQNLKRTGAGVFHVTDDVELFAHAAIGEPDPLPRLSQAVAIEGSIIADACRWFEFQVQSLDDQSDRSRMVARTVASGRNRDFVGFNRAKHAVIEAAILATRVHLLPAEELLGQYQRLASSVEKTAGAPERRAFDFLEEYVRRHHASVDSCPSVSPKLEIPS